MATPLRTTSQSNLKMGALRYVDGLEPSRAVQGMRRKPAVRHGFRSGLLPQGICRRWISREMHRVHGLRNVHPSRLHVDAHLWSHSRQDRRGGVETEPRLYSVPSEATTVPEHHPVDGWNVWDVHRSKQSGCPIRWRELSSRSLACSSSKTASNMKRQEQLHSLKRRGR